MKFTGEKKQIDAAKNKVFDFLSDFNNFEKLMPEQVTNWKSDSETCTFSIQGMTTITLKYSKKVPFSFIEVVPDGKAPISFTLQFNIEEVELTDQKSTGWVTIDADLNPMLAMIAKRPLENLVNVMSEKLNDIFSK